VSKIQQSILARLRAFLPIPTKTEPHLAGVLRHALNHPGNLVRPRLVLQVMQTLGAESEQAYAVGVAVEYFHTASLLLDDLPAMDDAGTRRGQTCAHHLYGEGATILGALAFINKAYAQLWSVIGTLDDDRSIACSRFVEQCLGLSGVLDGQARDLHFGPVSTNVDRVVQVACGKTASMIRLTMTLPAMIAGAEPEVIDRLDRIAFAWGLAYQGIDDLADIYLSTRVTGKSAGRDEKLTRPNLALALGPNAARNRIETHLRVASMNIQALCAESGDWSFLCHRHLQLREALALARSRDDVA